jgi:hypothetical protein
MAVPCEECIVYAICKPNHSREGSCLKCEVVWNYVVEETTGASNMKIWLKSKEFEVRCKRRQKIRELFPNVEYLEWMGDIF